MPQRKIGNRLADVRPDRIDLRDRPYLPRLVSLPDQYPSPGFIAQHLDEYVRLKLILDQGDEGACTGFGLAAVLNYLLWDRQRQQLQDDENVKQLASVSPRMIYQMARIYDEWPGEDYEGSSCRGAMKGWHRHGVCCETLWPYWEKSGKGKRRKKRKPSEQEPHDGWQEDAASRPLGAYYRINKDSIADMQAAIFEVGAIYCSGMVHSGWDAPKPQSNPESDPQSEGRLPRIEKPTDDSTGGHAFALTGYTPDGFIVQNSWGPDWGDNGFALLPYEDWIENGMDAWVAVLGAPIRFATNSRTRSSKSLEATSSGRASWFWNSSKTGREDRYQNDRVKPLDEGTAYEQTVVLGNDGQPLNSFLIFNTARRGLRETVFKNPNNWFRGQSGKVKRLAIYAHGGLNSEADSLKRVSVMAPYFQQNGIYPLFITWKSGPGESLVDIVADAAKQLLFGKDERAAGWLDDGLKQLSEAKNRALESVCSVAVRPLWTQMKQNAEAAAEPDSGLGLIVDALSDLKTSHPGLELHLIGHSAGSLVLGYLLELLTKKKLTASTCRLYAPACTVSFANEKYIPAIQAGTLDKRQLSVNLLSDRRELADTISAYGHSLMYLISRALENAHKTPLLGMQNVWLPEDKLPDDCWHRGSLGAVREWQKFAGKAIQPEVEDDDAIVTHRRLMEGNQWKVLQKEPSSHGGFDNNVNVLERTLLRLLETKKLAADVECLLNF